MSSNDYINLVAKIRLAFEQKQSFNLPLLKKSEFSRLMLQIKKVEA